MNTTNSGITEPQSDSHDQTEKASPASSIRDGRGGWSVYVHEGGRSYFIADVYGRTPEQQEANAELIAEAFNVSGETGLSPRQLAEHRKETSRFFDVLLDAHYGTAYHHIGDGDGIAEDVADEIRAYIKRKSADNTTE